MINLLAFLLVSFAAFADQGEIISMVRDHHLKAALEKLGSYCERRRPDLPEDINYHYVCLLQAKADCSHGEGDEKLEGCKVKDQVESLEKKVLVTDQHLSTLTKINIGSNLPKKKSEKNSKRQLEEALTRLKTAPMNMDCISDNDCELVYYGHGGCVKDHQGYLAMNKSSRSSEFITALSSYNDLKKRYDQASKEGLICLAVIQNFKAVCKSNICEGIEINWSDK